MEYMVNMLLQKHNVQVVRRSQTERNPTAGTPAENDSFALQIPAGWETDTALM